MSIEYLLSKKGEAVWPTNLYDCKNAVRYLRANADRLQIDPDHIGVIGGSAGGHLACMVALTGPDDKLEPDQPYPNISDKVNCCVDMYGVTDVGAHSPDAKWLGKSLAEDPQLYKLASPLTYVRPTSPPFLIIHGTADTTVAPNQSQMLEDALKKADVSEKLIWVKGAHHAFTLNPPQEDLRPMVLAFFDARLKPGRH
jgi:acetyl esterase/lipase